MSVIILRGDAAHLPLPDASVDLICTSPPFWGLRDYQDGGESLNGQIGSEPTPGEYIANLLACTREWMRVLKPGGSIFVNLGDKYSQPGKGERNMQGLGGSVVHKVGARQANRSARDVTYDGVPGKSLLGLPWRYAIGCVDDLGLILRAEIVWSKVNGMPESVARGSRRYAAGDLFSVGTPNTLDPHQFCNPLGALPGSVWEIASQPLAVPAHLGADHYAAFPMELPRRVILGWSPSGICTGCGEGRRPVVGKRRVKSDPITGSTYGGPGRKPNTGNHEPALAAITGSYCACTPFTDHPERRGRDFRAQSEDLASPRGPVREYHFDAWAPAPTRPAIVLDPFAGTGTTMLVASTLGRIGIGVDRSSDYCRIAQWRTSDPAERARALGVPKPPPVMDNQGSLFDQEAS